MLNYNNRKSYVAMTGVLSVRFALTRLFIRCMSRTATVRTLNHIYRISLRASISVRWYCVGDGRSKTIEAYEQRTQ